jgi:hypothetical protein
MHGQARDDPHKADGDFSLLEQHLRSKQSQSVNLRGVGGGCSAVQRRPQPRHNRRLHCIRRVGVNVAVIFVSEETIAVYCRLSRCRQKAVGKHDTLGRLESLTLKVPAVCLATECVS